MANNEPPVAAVPKEFAGRWIAWNRTRTAIVASGRTLEDARRAAKAKGEAAPILGKAPSANVRFLGGVR